MSEVTQVNATENQSQFNYDTSKIFIFANRYEGITFTNLTAGVLDFAVGTVLGRVSATGKVTEMKSGASDGSELPIGILATEITALAGTTDVDVNMCVAGDISEDKVLFNGADVITTPKSGRIYRDWLQLAGMKLVTGTELTNFDNQ